ncbi:MAG: DUF5916 domain-containing protein [Pseudomonadales bacterium]|nr:DUF5916 domain-containing protein [Pseudomonadales bacterium]
MKLSSALIIWPRCSLILLLLANTVWAQPPAPLAQAPAVQATETRLGREIRIPLQRFEENSFGINIDGRVDEAAWKQVEPVSGMRIIDPETLAAAPYKTYIRVLYTDDGLYMSVDMEQPLDTLVQRIAARDNRDVSRDRITFTLDTSSEGQYGYWVSLALGDSQLDGTILPERQYTSQWDGAWYGATAVTETGWSAEFYLPWGQLSMPLREDKRTIGVYVERVVAHLNQNWAWPPIARSNPIFMSNFPLLELDGVNPRQQWSLFPSTASTYDDIDKKWRHRTGADIFWRPSSNFQLTATVNPDFGSAEADDVVVNLTATEVFFPEKRLFFQEGQEIFNTNLRSNGSSGKRFTIINTRRIGGRPRSPDLPAGVSLPARERIQNSDLMGAAKVTGQAGKLRYGLLAAIEDETTFHAGGLSIDQDGRDFAAVRLLYEDTGGGAAYRGLGYIGTLVAHPESDAAVHAVDFHYLTNGGVWNFDGQLVASDVDDKGEGFGAYTDIIYAPRQGMTHTLNLSWLDDKLEVNDFGFLDRNDSREAWYRFEWIKTGLTRVRDIRFNPFIRYEENRDGDRINNAIPVMSMTVTLNNLDRFTANFQHFPKRYDDLNSFGNGTFGVRERNNYSFSYQTDRAKRFSYRLGAGTSTEFAGGNSHSIDGQINWRPQDNLSFSAEVNFDDRDGWLLHQGGQDFTAFNTEQWRTNFRFEYFISAKQQLTAGLQWVGIRAREDRFFILPNDAPSKNRDLIEGSKPPGPTDSFSISQMNFQLRYRWEIAPLSDLFVVYTRNANNRANGLVPFNDQFDGAWTDPLISQLVIKLRYRLGT